MKLITKLVVSMLAVLVFAYYGSEFVMPSITIVNDTGQNLKQMKVALPSSNLDFGAIKHGEQNTLLYTLKQNDGAYQYKFKHENSAAVSGTCGYVTKNEIHKRVIITLKENNEVVCTTE
jgi:hypothetical protein